MAFQSTPSLRKATNRTGPGLCDRLISIHTFLAEGDKSHMRELSQGQIFQSTPSLRKATIADVLCNNPRIISIHTFLAEGDEKHLTKSYE